jgi:hypothetical protein
MKSIYGYIAAFIAGILAFFAFTNTKKSEQIVPDFKPLEQQINDKLKESEKKEEELDKKGVDKKTPQEVIDYWKEQK